jgi:hypothetical protein
MNTAVEWLQFAARWAAGRRNLYLSKERPESYGIAARRPSRVKLLRTADVSRSMTDRGIADIEAFGNRSQRPAVFVRPSRVVAAHVEHADSAVLARWAGDQIRAARRIGQTVRRERAPLCLGLADSSWPELPKSPGFGHLSDLKRIGRNGGDRFQLTMGSASCPSAAATRASCSCDDSNPTACGF